MCAGYGTIVSPAVQPKVAPKMSRVVVVSASLAATALVAVACGVAFSQATGNAELAVRHYRYLAPLSLGNVHA